MYLFLFALWRLRPFNSRNSRLGGKTGNLIPSFRATGGRETTTHRDATTYTCAAEFNCDEQSEIA